VVEPGETWPSPDAPNFLIDYPDVFLNFKMVAAVASAFEEPERGGDAK
jgi:hypothetical protein